MKFKLVQDNDCHWAVIPADKLSAWYEFLNSYSYTDAGYPDWCDLVGGSPDLVTFTGSFEIE